VRLHEFGGADKLIYEDAPKPSPGPGEVLVRVHAAGVNPADWKVREGYFEAMIPHALPLILGWDVSGTIEAVGDGVTEWAVGDVIWANLDIARDGAYAEYVVARAEILARKPDGLSHVEAASLPVAALTAWQSLFEVGGLQAGQTVLIHAAAGGVGSVAVQLAHAHGVHVIGTASARNHDYLQDLGADDLIDYNAARFEDVAKNVDVVLDTMGGETQARSWGVLKPGGILVSLVGPPDADAAKAHNVRAAFWSARSDARDLDKIAAFLSEGKLKPTLGATFPLADARRAHEQSESGHTRGKIVLEVA